jgi:4-hydroxy-tetrahydrodipicolinate synthase
MDRNSVNFGGVIPAVVTPFGDDGKIAEGVMQGLIERMLDDGANGILVGGCTGEFWSLSFEERCSLYRRGVIAVAGSGTVLAGTGAITVDETLLLTAAAASAGCDAALILPPYFIRLNDDEIFEHFRAIDASTELPIVLYNIPGNAINAITPELALRLSELPNVVAIKESSGDWNNFHATLLRVGDRLRVFCGPSSLFGAAAVAAGADGFIDCFPNVWADGGLPLYQAALDNNRERVNELQAIGRRLTELFTSDGRSLYPATKAAMVHLGIPAGLPRPPLQPLTGRKLQGLHDGLETLNIH